MRLICGSEREGRVGSAAAAPVGTRVAEERGRRRTMMMRSAGSMAASSEKYLPRSRQPRRCSAAQLGVALQTRTGTTGDG